MSTEAKLITRLVADNQGLKRKLNESKRDLSRFQKSTGSMMKKVQSSFLLAFGGIGLYQVLNKTIGTLAEFEFQMSKVRAISGASESTMEKLIANAKELGAKSKFTATEIGKLQEELAKLGFTADQIINLTDASRQLATVADSELGAAAKTVGQVINAFGLEASESTEIANIMAESFSSTALDLESFSTAMGNVGANAKAFGLTVAETTARLGALTDAGIDASKAGTDLRMILIETNKRGLTLNEAFEKVRNSTDKLGTATELFGTRAGAAGIILAENSQKVDILTQKFSDNEKEMSKMSDTMEDNLITDFEKLKSAVDGLIIEQGGGLNGWLRNVTQNTTTAVTILDQFVTLVGKLRGNPADLIIEALKPKEKKSGKVSLTGFKRTAFTGTQTDFEATQSGIFQRGVSGAQSMGSGFDALRGIGDIDVEEIKNNGEDIINAYGVIAGGFDINADLLAEATEKMEGSLAQMGATGPTVTEQAMQVYEPLKKFGDELGFVAQGIATGFAQMADNIFSGTEKLGQALTKGFSSMMRSIGFKFIEAGALFFANSLLAKAATGGIPNPLSISNSKDAFRSIGIGVALGATGGILGKMANASGGSGGSGASFNGPSNSGGQNINLSGQFRVRGADLVYVLDRERNITGRTG